MISQQYTRLLNDLSAVHKVTGRMKRIVTRALISGKKLRRVNIGPGFNAH